MKQNKNPLIEVYSNTNRDQKEFIIQFVFSICTTDNFNVNDDLKIEDFANRFDIINIQETLTGYRGWDVMADNLKSLPNEVKEFLVIDTQPLLFVDGSINVKRLEKAMKVFNKIGISEERYKEIYKKAQAFHM
mgnify:CR=1 FL=1|jgi:hypothetical protein